MALSNSQIIEDLRWKKFPVLNDGFITLVDCMGADESIVQAARVSYGKDERDEDISGNEGLLRYLMRNRHTTPFEMCELKLLVRVPMDTWRQWIRHRTANVNEYSTRYTEAINSMQTTPPDGWRSQSASNKQGSGDFLDALSIGQQLSEEEAELHSYVRTVYENRLKDGVAKEQARKDLPLSTYTEAYWKIDLHNLFHFLGLRKDGHAQKEIREFANAVGDHIVAPLFPQAWKAFQDYRFHAMYLSRWEIACLVEINKGWKLEYALQHFFSNIREREECRKKLAQLGVG